MHTLNISADTEGPKDDLQWHVEKCEGVLLFVEIYLCNDVVPTKLSFQKGRAFVTVRIEGYKQSFQIWEAPAPTKKNPRAVRYYSDFDFGTFVETIPVTTSGICYVMCV